MFYQNTNFIVGQKYKSSAAPHTFSGIWTQDPELKELYHDQAVRIGALSNEGSSYL